MNLAGVNPTGRRPFANCAVPCPVAAQVRAAPPSLAGRRIAAQPRTEAGRRTRRGAMPGAVGIEAGDGATPLPPQPSGPPRTPVLVVAANLLLLALFPLSWSAPLARAGLVPWFGGSEITILSAVKALWASAPVLALLVAGFALLIPYAKTLALAAVHLGLVGPAAVPWLERLGRLSMADVFLVALLIVVAKGTGVGYVAPAWGLWLFTGCVLASMAVALLTAGRA